MSIHQVIDLVLLYPEENVSGFDPYDVHLVINLNQKRFLFLIFYLSPGLSYKQQPGKSS